MFGNWGLRTARDRLDATFEGCYHIHSLDNTLHSGHPDSHGGEYVVPERLPFVKQNALNSWSFPPIALSQSALAMGYHSSQ